MAGALCLPCASCCGTGILSKYDESSLTAADARAINEAFREVGPRNGPALQQAIRDAGFVPEKIGELDPPPDRPGDERTPPEKPKRPDRRKAPPDRPEEARGGGYSIEQAISDRAQLHTIAFDALAFLTGDFGCNTFLPPGKVADFCGFQYMRDVDTNELGHRGEAFLASLTEPQRKLITDLVDQQRQDLNEIVDTRRVMALELRQFMREDSVDKDKVLALARRYGELDGEISYYYARAFSEVAKTLTASQKQTLLRLRNLDAKYTCQGAYLYSSPLATPDLPNTDFLFTTTKKRTTGRAAKP